MTARQAVAGRLRARPKKASPTISPIKKGRAKRQANRAPKRVRKPGRCRAARSALKALTASSTTPQDQIPTQVRKPAVVAGSSER